MPDISVIIPMYNTEQYINRCIISFLDQTFRNLELIIVDDGSIDQSAAISEEYACTHEDIIVIHQRNQGQARARNMGLDFIDANSKSNWLTFVDSDDWVHSRYLECLFRAIKKYGTRISVCDYQEAKEYIKVENNNEKVLFLLTDTEQVYCNKNILTVVPWGKLYHKTCFQTIRYPVGKICEDEFTIYKVMFEDEKVAFVEAPLYYYFYNENSVTQSNSNLKRLDGLAAMLECSVFLRNSIYQNAYDFSLKKSIFYISEVYLQNSDELLREKDKLKYLRKTLRKLLKLSREKHLLDFSKNKYVYEIAYPNRMKCYWFMQTLVSKLRPR